MNQTFVFSLTEIHLEKSWKKCVGLYCGHIENNTDCGSCPWGMRVYDSVNQDSLCSQCVTAPDLHGWLYLGFTAMLPLFFLLFTFPSCTSPSPVTHSTSPNSPQVTSSKDPHASTVIIPSPVILQRQSPCGGPSSTCKDLSWGLIYFAIHCLSAFLSLLLFSPFGELTLHSCMPQGLEDFYAPFLTGSGCPSEVVFPYLSLPLTYFGFCILGCVFLYGALLLTPVQSTHSSKWLHVTHLSLYAYPFFGLTILLFGGLLYFTYPYFVLALAVIHSVYRFPAMFDYCAPSADGSLLPMCHPWVVLSSLVCTPEPGLALTFLINLFCFSYSLFSLNASLLWVLVLTFLPFLFYVFTLPFTHPFATPGGEERLQLAMMRRPGLISFSVPRQNHTTESSNQDGTIQRGSVDG